MSRINNFLQFLALLLLLIQNASAQLDYKDALMKSILFYEGQRSGPLDLSKLRNTWRSSSALKDGFNQGVDLTGGYYDAGDNIKFHFPLSFSMTMLAWSIIEYQNELSLSQQLGYAQEALKWGSDYLMKCHTAPNEFWGQVGVGKDDHDCWQRPEDMGTLRTAFKIDASEPGSDLAAEAAAALAAASIVFKTANPSYSSALLGHSQDLFNFAKTYKGVYSQSIPDAAKYYNSWSGYNDELAWAAAWLYKATRDFSFMSYLVTNDGSLGTSGTSMNEFSWDNKYAGAQILLAGISFTSTGFDSNTIAYLNKVKLKADAFACSLLQKSVKFSPQGLLFYRGVNMQYVMNAAFLVVVYRDYLQAAGKNLACGSTSFTTSSMLAFSKRQMDYMLGDNNAKMSYMVGFGSKYPLKPHHRGASIVSIRKDSTGVTCQGGFSWYNSANPNPNILTGAIVGGPDQRDNYVDARDQYNFGEPTTYNNAPAVGVLAKLYGLYSTTTKAPPSSPPTASQPPPPKASPPPPPKASPPPPPKASPPPPPKASPPPPPKASPPSSPKASPPPSPKASPPPPPKASPPSPPKASPPPPQSSSSPPPPSTTLSPPPSISSPPPQTSSPPPASQSGSVFSFVQNIKNQWVENNNVQVTQYEVVVSYSGPGTAKTIQLSIPGFNPTGYWGIEQTSTPGVYKTPDWVRLNPSQTYSFGYQGYNRASISVFSYATQ